MLIGVFKVISSVWKSSSYFRVFWLSLYVRAIQYKLELESLTRLGNSNVLRLPVTPLIEEILRRIEMFRISKMLPVKFAILNLVHKIRTRGATESQSPTNKVNWIWNFLLVNLQCSLSLHWIFSFETNISKYRSQDDPWKRTVQRQLAIRFEFLK